MTVDEIIQHNKEILKYCIEDGYERELAIAEATIVALKAGKAMYLDLQTVAKDKAEDTGQPLKDFEYFSAIAWDEATKEEEVGGSWESQSERESGP